MVGQVYDGPLDLLLDLIRKQDIDIYDIPIARITEQYLKYVETMKGFDVDVAAEFIYTASLLIHIKSKMLLPRDPDAAAGEEDPRMELVNRLLEHERFKTAAQMLMQKQQIEESGVVESGAEGISRCRRHRAGAGRRCSRPGQDVSADSGSRAHSGPSFDVNEEAVTVSQMIDYRAAAAVAGRAAGATEAIAAQPAIAVGAGLRVSGDPGADTITGGAGAAGQCVRRDRAEEAHELRFADGGKSAGARMIGGEVALSA